MHFHHCCILDTLVMDQIWNLKFAFKSEWVSKFEIVFWWFSWVFSLFSKNVSENSHGLSLHMFASLAMSLSWHNVLMDAFQFWICALAMFLIAVLATLAQVELTNICFISGITVFGWHFNGGSFGVNLSSFNVFFWHSSNTCIQDNNNPNFEQIFLNDAVRHHSVCATF